MRRDPSSRVLAFARPAAGALPAAESRDNVVTTTPSPPLPLTAKPETPFDFNGAGGFEESVRELRAMVAAAQRRQRAAMSATPLDESLVSSCTRTVEKQLDLLRKAENDLFEFQRKRGELVPLIDIREDWRTLLAALRQMRRRMAGNISDELAKSSAFTAEQLERVRAAVESERSREDQLLRGSKFWRRPDDVPAATAAAA